MSNYFKFGNKITKDFNMHIEKYPAIKGATRKRTTVSVAGHNGDLHSDEGAYTNYKQPYACYFHGDVPTPEQAHAIRAWLHSSGEYLKLEDTYDPKYYRMATFIGPLDVNNYLNKYGRCTVYFDCAPQYFLKSGDFPVTFSQSGVISNPTSEKALPLIKVYGPEGSGTVTIGSVMVEIKSIDGELILDCEVEDAYKLVNGEKINENGNINAPNFPELLPGENTVSFAGTIKKIEIIPRWWEP